jgi:hypothetical protein
VLSTYIVKQHETKLGPADPTSPEWIPAFLGAQSNEKNHGLTAGYFRAKLKAGRCHVPIDGLGEPSRERLGRLIHQAAAAFLDCQFVVTSRPEGEIRILGFEEALIGDPGAAGYPGVSGKARQAVVPG